MIAKASLLDEQYEVIDGRIVSMAPPSTRHIDINGNIHTIFHNYLKGKKCKVFFMGYVHLSSKDIFIPDVFIVCDRSKIRNDGHVYGAPDLVVEILSPSTASTDRGHKFLSYGAYGVKEYWLVDPNKLLIEVYLPIKKHDGYVFDLARTYRYNADKQFKTTLYDDLVIKLDDVFFDV